VQGLQAFKNFITGPAEPVVNRVRNQYLFDVLLKLPKDAQIINNCKVHLHQQVVITQTNKRYRSVDIIIDVDPV